jgi:hypothetical protein
MVSGQPAWDWATIESWAPLRRSSMIVVDTSAWTKVFRASVVLYTDRTVDVLARHTRLRTERYRTLHSVPRR